MHCRVWRDSICRRAIPHADWPKQWCVGMPPIQSLMHLQQQAQFVINTSIVEADLAVFFVPVWLLERLLRHL